MCHVLIVKVAARLLMLFKATIIEHGGGHSRWGMAIKLKKVLLGLDNWYNLAEGYCQAKWAAALATDEAKTWIWEEFGEALDAESWSAPKWI